jgi:hypothetical protein
MEVQNASVIVKGMIDYTIEAGQQNEDVRKEHPLQSSN